MTIHPTPLALFRCKAMFQHMNLELERHKHRSHHKSYHEEILEQTEGNNCIDFWNAYNSHCPSVLKKSCYIPRFQISKISQKNEIALVTKLFFSFNWGRGEGKEHSNFKIKFPCSFQLIFPFKPNYHHTTDFELLTKATMATFSLHQKHNWDSMRDSHTSHHPVTRSHSRFHGLLQIKP